MWKTFAERLRTAQKRGSSAATGGLQTSQPTGTGVRQFGFGAGCRLYKSEESQVKQRKLKEERSSRHQWVDFTEKWDSDHPTTCCGWKRTRIGRSLRPELGNTRRKIVSKYEVDAFNWECIVDITASAFACDMHASW